MAIFHLHTKNFNKTKSALGVVAYRSGTRLVDWDKNKVYNYTKKQHVEYSTMLFPEGVNRMDREEFWNKAQRAEKQANGRYGKELEFSLPRELDREKQIEIAKKFLQENFVDKGYVVDMNLHVPNAIDGEEQPHIHALVAVRKLNKQGEFEKTKARKVYALDDDGNRIPILNEDGEQKIGAKGRRLWKRIDIQKNELDGVEALKRWRTSWQNILNEALPDDQQVSCKTLEKQGINRLPTQHEGFVARKIARRGGTSWRVELNKQIKQTNDQIARIEAELEELYRRQEEEQAAEKENEKEKLQKERSDHRAEMLAYDLLKQNGTDMANWLDVWRAADELANSRKIDNLYELSQAGMHSYDINDFANNHGLKEAKWLQKSLATYKTGAARLRSTAYDAMTQKDKQKVDDELQKRKDEETLNQAPDRHEPEHTNEGFTAAPQKHDSATYEQLKQALRQIDRTLDNTTSEKARAMRDYEAAQRAVAREQKRMQDDFDM